MISKRWEAIENLYSIYTSNREVKPYYKQINNNNNDNDNGNDRN